VAFFQDGEPLGERQRLPWTVSVNLGQIARRTVVSGQAFGTNGDFLGEDAVVLNAASQQIPVELLLGRPGSRCPGDRLGGPAGEGQSVVLKLDDRAVARWTECRASSQCPARTSMLPG